MPLNKKRLLTYAGCDVFIHSSEIALNDASVQSLVQSAVIVCMQVQQTMEKTWFAETDPFFCINPIDASIDTQNKTWYIGCIDTLGIDPPTTSC